MIDLQYYIKLFVVLATFGMILGHIIDPEISFTTHFLFSTCVLAGIITWDGISYVIRSYLKKRRK